MDFEIIKILIYIVCWVGATLLYIEDKNCYNKKNIWLPITFIFCVLAVSYLWSPLVSITAILFIMFWKQLNKIENPSCRCKEKNKEVKTEEDE